MNWEELDNPVWNSLLQTHDQYVALFPHLQAYLPEYLAFAASLEPNKVSNSLEIYSQLTPSFYFVGDKPSLPKTLSFFNEVVCDQMVWFNKTPFVFDASLVTPLQNVNEEIIALTTSVLPGYIRPQTPELGDFFGIYMDGKLVSIAGERLQTDQFIEVSGCVTDPQYQHRGFQTTLLKMVINNILKKGKTPFLHVSSSNTKAISIYKKLGFAYRRKISFWGIQ